MTAALVVLIAAGTAQGLIATGRSSGEQRHKSQADQLAQQDQERLKGLSDQQLTAMAETRTVVLDTTTFTIVSTATFLSTSGGSSCGSGGTAYFEYVQGKLELERRRERGVDHQPLARG